MKLVLNGGFLGSGKTTAIVNACRQLMRAGQRVGVITNDQGSQQVDTAFVKNFGIPAAEVANGCFCCNYDQFRESIQALVKTDSPRLIFAEAVGSCTDLIATLVRPLKKDHPDLGCVICIFVDATLLIAILEQRANFIDESVRYIFRKQLEEADILIINKQDLVIGEQVELIRGMLAVEFPGKEIIFQNSADEADIGQWIETLEKYSLPASRESLDIDYNIYGAGEEALTWCDDTVTIRSRFRNSIEIAGFVIGNIFDALQQERLVIGHLKFLVSTCDDHRKISFTTTSTRSSIDISLKESDKVVLLINARVQADPQPLRAIVEDAFFRAEKTFGCQIEYGEASVFRPGFPKPTHRIGAT